MAPDPINDFILLATYFELAFLAERGQGGDGALGELFFGGAFIGCKCSSSWSRFIYCFTGSRFIYHRWRRSSQELTMHVVNVGFETVIDDYNELFLGIIVVGKTVVGEVGIDN